MATIKTSSSSPYLYTLSLDCPIPWPANPSYPIQRRPGGGGGAAAARPDAIMAAVDSDKGRGGAAKGAAASTRTAVLSRSAGNSSHAAGLLGAPVSEQELRRVDGLELDVDADGQPEQEGETEIELETEEMVEDAPWPGSLHALYLECLYAVRQELAYSRRSATRRGCR